MSDPLAYSVTVLSVMNDEELKEYVPLANAAVQRHEGRFLVQGAVPIVAEGSRPTNERMVIIEFPSMMRLQTWYDSEDYARAREIAAIAMRRTLMFVEGITTPAR